MISVNILKMAEEKGTLALLVVVTDENGTAVTPLSLRWTLSDRDGTIINNRNQVVVGVPASSQTIYLAGNDLQIIDQTKQQEWRLFTVQTDMGDLAKPQHIEKGFWVKNLKNIT